VAKLEEQVGRKLSGALILVGEGETKKQALRRHYREHPEQRDAEFFIILDCSQGEEGGHGEANHQDAAPHLESVPSPPRSEGSKVRGTQADKPSDHLQKLKMDRLAQPSAGEEELGWPLRLDRDLPFESWDGYFCQRGVWFHSLTFEPINPTAPLPVQPEKLDIRQRRTPIIWNGQECYLQNGWLFSRSTHEAIEL
jgi:hypothetical protein